MLLDLERMQAADWQRRRQALHQAPPAVSSSSHTHTHTHTLADDGQRRLEHAFQDLYTNERSTPPLLSSPLLSSSLSLLSSPLFLSLLSFSLLFLSSPLFLSLLSRLCSYSSSPLLSGLCS